MHQTKRDFNNAPMVITWEVTQACDLTCEHCRADANTSRHPDELGTEEGFRLLDQIAAFGDQQPILVFSGGDPLNRPDLFELVSYATESGIPTAVTPAPTQNLTEEAIANFIDAGVRRIALSLDGATPDRHDTFRGQPGSFRQIRRTASMAREMGLGIQINTTVTAKTVSDLPPIADHVASMDAAMWEVFFLVPIGRGSSLTQITPQCAERTLGWLYRRQLNAPFRVITVEAPQYRRIARRIETHAGNEPPIVGSTGDGNGFLFISHVGDIYPSGFLPLSTGNVRTDDIVSVYRTNPLLESLRDPSQLKGPCGDCSHRKYCGGSRARAYATTGDPLASDPLCVKVTSGDSSQLA